MARYAKVDVRVWDDDKVSEMTPIPPCGQGLWIRLLVSRHRSSIPGLLCVGEAALAEEFHWSLEAFREAFREASSKGLVKADWKARVVWLPNAWKFNAPESPNVVKSWRIPWDETPECALKLEAFSALKAFIGTLKKGFGEAFDKACRKPSVKAMPIQEPDPDPEQEVSLSARDPGDSISDAGVLTERWYGAFKAEWWKSKGRQYGQGNADVKAKVRLTELLAGLAEEERQADWETRGRFLTEFLSKADQSTTSAGWSFAFFVSDFNGLRVPPEQRPKNQNGNCRQLREVKY